MIAESKSRADTSWESKPFVVPPEKHLGLVRRIARQYAERNPGSDLEDFVGAGTLGLIKACKTFEPERGNAFSTHASWQIKGALTRFAHKEMRNRGWGLRGSSSADSPQDWVRIVTVDAASQIGGDGYVQQHEAPSFVVDESPELNVLMEMLYVLLRERELRIVEARVLRGLTLEETAKEHGLTRERVRQIQDAALEKVRAAMEKCPSRMRDSGADRKTKSGPRAIPLERVQVTPRRPQAVTEPVHHRAATDGRIARAQPNDSPSESGATVRMLATLLREIHGLRDEVRAMRSELERIYSRTG